MRAVVLAGGPGTRLLPYTAVLPKPLVPVGDRPVLEHILHRLAGHGVTDVDLCIGHLGELIQAYFHGGRNVPPGMALRWHRESAPRGTAGAVSGVPDLPSAFIVMNGDVLTSLDMRALIAHHLECQAVLTIAVQRHRTEIGLGVVEIGEAGVTAYREKPVLEHDVSLGVYVFDARALELMPSVPCQVPELVRAVLDAGEHVAAFRSDAAWHDVGTPRGLEAARRA